MVQLSRYSLASLPENEYSSWLIFCYNVSQLWLYIKDLQELLKKKYHCQNGTQTNWKQISAARTWAAIVFKNSQAILIHSEGCRLLIQCFICKKFIKDKHWEIMEKYWQNWEGCSFSSELAQEVLLRYTSLKKKSEFLL